MSLHKGSLNIAEVYKGSLAIASIYKGSSLIWEKNRTREFKPTLFYTNDAVVKEVFASKDGYYFVTDKNGKLKVLDKNGILKNTFNFKSSSDVGSGNTISNWCNTVCGDDNYLYLNDHSTDKVFVLSYNGYSLTLDQILHSGFKLIYGSYFYNGYLYMVTSEKNKQEVLKMNVSDGTCYTIASYHANNDKSALTDIIVDEDTGNIFIVLYGGGDTSYYSNIDIALVKLAPDGTELKHVNLCNNQNLDNALNNVNSICFDSNGYIYTCQRITKNLNNGNLQSLSVWEGGTDIYDKDLNLVLKDTAISEPYIHSGYPYLRFDKIQYDQYSDSLLCNNLASGGAIYSIPPYNFNS